MPVRTPASALSPRVGALLSLLVAALVAGAGSPAHAHTELLASSPAAGESVPTGADQLSLSFAEEVLPGSGSVQVVAPDGADVTGGDAVAEGSLVRVPLSVSDLGEHTVRYRVVAADGHVVTGSFTFEVVAGGPGDRPWQAPAAFAPVADDEGSGTLTVLVWLCVSTSAAALLLLHRRRRFLHGPVPAVSPVQRARVDAAAWDE